MTKLIFCLLPQLPGQQEKYPLLKSIDCGDRILPYSLYFHKRIPLQNIAYPCGTCRFGDDPQTSVVDLDCRTHDIENLHAVDSSFFRFSAV